MSTAPAPTAPRTVQGQPFPAPGRYEVDPNHSTVEAVARHLVVSKVRGSFSRFSGEILVGEQPEDSSVSIDIEAASIDTRAADRDAHLRSPDFLDVDSHPQLTYRSSGARLEGGSWKVDGDLSIRGAARPVTLDVDYLGTVVNPWGAEVAAFSARAEIDREQWGITWNQALEAGGVLVGPKLKIELEIQAAKQA